MYSTLFALRVLKSKVDLPVLVLVYHALVQSHLSYGLMLWGNSSQSIMQRVLRIQKKAIRILCGLKYTDSCRPMFRQLKILTVTGLYIHQILNFVHNNKSCIKQDVVSHTYHTRNSDSLLRPQKHLTSIYEKSVSYSGIKLYNNLPHHLKALKPNAFKSRLKIFLINQPFYDLNEFMTYDKSQMCL